MSGKPKQIIDPCPKCGGETEMGFGLAGGGYGPYRWCPECAEVIEKWQEEPEDESKSSSGRSDPVSET
jgi:hypothetical protein